MRGGELRVWTATANSCVCCGAVWCGRDGGRGSRRRRIKATCGAHGETKTRVCVCVIPRGKEEVPRGRQRGSLGTHEKQRKDAEKRKSPGGRPRAAPLVPGDRGRNNGREVRHNPRRGQTQKKRPAEGRGGARGPPGHTLVPAKPHTPKPRTPPTHPATTPRRHTRHTPATHPARHTRHTPATHPANTPPTHPTHARDTPGTHPPSRAPTHPKHRRCGTGLREVCGTSSHGVCSRDPQRASAIAACFVRRFVRFASTTLWTGFRRAPGSLYWCLSGVCAELWRREDGGFWACWGRVAGPD